jgi:hypothetical protein
VRIYHTGYCCSRNDCDRTLSASRHILSGVT